MRAQYLQDDSTLIDLLNDRNDMIAALNFLMTGL